MCCYLVCYFTSHGVGLVCIVLAGYAFALFKSVRAVALFLIQCAPIWYCYSSFSFASVLLLFGAAVTPLNLVLLL